MLKSLLSILWIVQDVFKKIGELRAAVEMCNGCGAYDETLSQSLRVCCTDQLLLGWDLLKYLTATSDQFLHAYRWAQTSWIRFLQMAYRLCGRSLKISQTGFPISNNQPLPVPPSVGQVLIFKQKHRYALAEVTLHSVIAEWTESFPSMAASVFKRKERLWAALSFWM